MEDNFRCKSTFCGIFSYFGVVFIFLVNDNDTLENDEEAHKVVLYTISYFLIFFICRGDEVKITMVEEDVYIQCNDTIEYDDHAYKVILYTYD